MISQALANNERNLANQLLGHYPSPKFIRPVEDPADAVPLYLRYTAVTISDFDDDAGQLTINGYVKTVSSHRGKMAAFLANNVVNIFSFEWKGLNFD